MQRADAIPQIGSKRRDDNPIILTPGADYNESHKGWKIVAQAKALKEHFGFGTVFGLIAVFISLATPIAYQSKTNGATAAAVDNLTRAQEQMLKTTTESIARIEAQVNRSVDLATQNREDMRSIREEMNRRVDKIETLSQSNWNKMVEVSNRVGIVEAKQATQKER